VGVWAETLIATSGKRWRCSILGLFWGTKCFSGAGFGSQRRRNNIRGMEGDRKTTAWLKDVLEKGGEMTRGKKID